MMPILYTITNKIDGKFYIGVTACGLKKRKREHLCAARAGRAKTKLHNAIRKYGEENFVFEELMSFNNYQEALKKEVQLISEMKPHYNLTLGGQGVLGCRHSQEIIDKIASKNRGRVGWWRGKKRSEEDCLKISLGRRGKKPWNVGVPMKKESIDKMRLSKTGKKRPPCSASAKAVYADNMRRAAKAKRKPIKCLNDGMVFESGLAASLHYGIGRTSACAVANGKASHAHGLRFEYANVQRAHKFHD